ncbi:glutamyl-tRNA reductase [Planctomycetales bacterium ZRK34]|nr:glutamyl-tRNA reductase [Planctomycetales bacterium ZRK34]
MSILLLGLSHRTAPVEVREQLAFTPEGAATALMLFQNRYPEMETLLLSTCNRTEILVASQTHDLRPESIIEFIAQARDIPVEHFRRCLYQYTDEQAIRHLFRVTSGLDSMVVGEYQIVSQIKQAYAIASEQGTTGRLLNRLMHHALKTSSRVRTETEIAARKVSVPSVAVDIARDIFQDFGDKQILVVGAGEMAQLVCQHLQAVKARNFVVTSRTLNNARALAEACKGRAVPYDQVEQQLADADIIVTAVRCPKAVLTTERVRAVQKQRQGRPMFILDLAVPRNVEAGVGDLSQVYLYDIDTLGDIVAQNKQARLKEITHCERILDEEIDQFEKWLAEGRSGPMIAQMYSDARQLREAELSSLIASCPDLTARQRDAVSKTVDRVIAKLMHPAVSTVRQHSVCEKAHACAQSEHNHLCSPVNTLTEALHKIILRVGENADRKS